MGEPQQPSQAEAALNRGGDLTVREEVNRLAKAVCYIKTPTQGGTGFYAEICIRNISKRYMVTNYHVIRNEEEAKRCQFHFLYESRRTKYSNVLQFEPTVFHTGGEECNDNDFTILGCSKKLNEDLATLNIEPIHLNAVVPDNYLLSGKSVVILQHPNHAPLSESREKITSADNNILTYDVDTLGGSSGSPVLLSATLELLALHFGTGKGNNGVLVNSIVQKLEALPDDNGGGRGDNNRGGGDNGRDGDGREGSGQSMRVGTANEGNPEVADLPDVLGELQIKDEADAPTITDLKPKHWKTFSDLLLKNPRQEFYYVVLLRRLRSSSDGNVKIPDPEEIITELKDPGRFTIGKILLGRIAMENPELSLESLSTKLDRNDIMVYIKKNNAPHITVGDLVSENNLNPKIQWDIAVYLTVNIPAYTWKDAVYCLIAVQSGREQKKKQNACIAELQEQADKVRSDKINTLWNLFSWLEVMKPDMKLTGLVTALRAAKINSVANEVEKIAKKIVGDLSG